MAQLPRRRAQNDAEPLEGEGTPVTPGSDNERLTASQGRGWDALKNERARRGGGAHRLQVKDRQVIIRFLEDEPFAVYRQHWVGNRSYSCAGKNCPLCDGGYDTRAMALFNVVDLSTGENMYWEAGPNAAKAIIDLTERPQTTPINKEGLYFAVTRSKQSNGFFAFTLTPIKERDLAEDYGEEALTPEELKEAAEHLFDHSVISASSIADLRAALDGAEEE